MVHIFKSMDLTVLFGQSHTLDTYQSICNKHEHYKLVMAIVDSNITIEEVKVYVKTINFLFSALILTYVIYIKNFA